MNVAEYVTAVAALAGLFTFAETRYAPAAQVEDLVWSGMKREIRELRREVAEGVATQEELDELLDRFCREFPDDRECKRG